MTEFEIMVLTLLDFMPLQALSNWIENKIQQQPEKICQYYDFLDDFSQHDIREYLNQHYFPFAENSPQVEMVLAKFLQKQIQQYLANEINECSFCNYFQRIEIHFMSYQRLIFANVIYYPEWLAGLYDACDWCEETEWHSENKAIFQTTLKQAMQRIDDFLNTPKIQAA